MGNRYPYIEEEQTTQWSKEKLQKDKQRSTKHTHKTKDRVTRTPLKTGQQVYSVRLPSASLIFSTDANAMLLALKFVASSDKSKFMICSDYLSCLLAIESFETEDHFI